MRPSAGEAIALRHGATRALITTCGAGLCALSVGGRALIDGDEGVCTDARGQLLMPWPNRIKDGRYVFAGRAHQLPIDEPDKHHAIHGLVRWATWRVVARDAAEVTLTYILLPQPGYPFTLALEVRYRLAPRRLDVEMRAVNQGAEPCPFAMGAHPYLAVGTEAIDAATLHLPAEEVIIADARSIPERRAPVALTPFDFRVPRLIGAARLDHSFTALVRDADGFARVTLSAGERRAVLLLGPAFGYLQAYTADATEDPARRRRSIALEPMSAAPDAFNSGDGLRVLAPGEAASGTWAIIDE